MWSSLHLHVYRAASPDVGTVPRQMLEATGGGLRYGSVCGLISPGKRKVAPGLALDQTFSAPVLKRSQ